MSVGEVCKQKLQNFVTFIATFTPPIYAHDLAKLTVEVDNLDSLKATFFVAQLVDGKESIIEKRDFTALCDSDIPDNVKVFLNEAIIPNTECHDKFWRYLDLFAKLTNSN